MKRVKVKPVNERSAEERAADAARLAEMFAHRQPPGTKGTDRAFLEDRHNGKQFASDPAAGEKYRQIAKRHGMHSVAGKIYQPGIARFPGDPQAWVSSVSDLVNRCKALGKNCTGIVDYNAPEMPPPPSKPLDDKIAERLMTQTILNNPDIAVRIKNGKQTLRDLKDDVVAKHSFKRKPAKKVVDYAG